MTAVPDFALFVGASLLLLVTPGPAVLYIVAQSVARGRTAGLVSSLGLAAGGALHLTAVVAGLSAALAVSPVSFEAVKYLGAGYLVYLGLRQLAGARAPSAGQEASPRWLFLRGMLVSVLNPKAAAFFLAFLPQFADTARGPLAPQLLALGLVFLSLALVTDSSYALLAGTARARIAGRPSLERAARHVSGWVYLALAGVTVLAGLGR